MKLKTIMSLALVVMLTACAGPSTSEPTTNPTTNPTVSNPTTSVDNPTTNPTTNPSVSDPTTVIPPTPVEKYVELTVDSLGIPSETYAASTATVGGIAFEFIQIGNYGDGIQMRDKDGKTSSLWNTSSLGGGVTKIELQYSSTKEVQYANPDAVIFSFGSSVNNYTYVTKLSTTAGNKSYTITPNSSSYSYLHIEHDLGYSMYWDSIKIYYNDGQGGTTPDNPTTQPSTPDNPSTSPSTPVAPQAKVVELTVDSLGIPSETYAASTATVNGVDFEFIQIGNYGDGIQMRDKDGKTSSLWNTSSFGSGITKIELQYSSTKDVAYSNPDAVVFSFGNAVNNYTYVTKLSTTAGTKSYTITPNSSSYSYLHIEHDLGYSMYWDYIKIYYGGDSGTSTPSNPTTSPSTPSNPTTSPSTPSNPSTQAKVVELTVTSLGIPSETYAASTATVNGINFEFIQIGNYGDGIQMRDKDGKTSSLWNTNAFGEGITKIELQYSSTKDVAYDNPDAVVFSFGSSVKPTDYVTKLSTTKGNKSYTITPNSSSYTYFHLEHDLGYSMYWDYIKIYYGGEPGTSNPGTSTPTTTPTQTPTTSKPSSDQPSQGDTYTGNYYDGISTTATGLTLLGELRELIVSTHDTYTSYSDCGGGSTKLAKTDYDPNNKSNILLFYSRASVSNNSSNFNREHVWPKSTGLWETSGGGADMHHIRPTKNNINSSRGNLEFGEVSNGSEVKQDGYLGGYKSGSTFEPLDHVKGDVARIILYMFVHYNTGSYLGSNNLTTGTVNSTASSKTSGNLPLTNVIQGSKEEAFALMVKWHNDDPVDQIEITRNNAVYEIQGNRNPFIDRPSYVNELWG